MPSVNATRTRSAVPGKSVCLSRTRGLSLGSVHVSKRGVLCLTIYRSMFIDRIIIFVKHRDLRLSVGVFGGRF